MCMFKNNIGRAYVNYVNNDEVEMKNADDYYRDLLEKEEI